MAWDENKKIKFTIDHNKVDETLYDFPVTMQISDSCGINLVDLTTTSGTTASGTIFDEATSALSPNYGFTGNDGDAPDYRQWYFSGINAMTYCSIQNNKLNYYSDTACDAWVPSSYELIGDFDWQIDFELVSHPETNNWSHHLMLTSTGFTVYLIREYGASTNRYRTAFYRLGVNAGGGGTTSRDDITGKLRFVRTGGTIYCYYWTGSWVLMSTSGFSDCTEPLRVTIRPWQDSGPALVEANFDNVQLNSGSVRWTQLNSKIAVFAGGDQNTGTRCFIDMEHWDTLNEEIVLHIGVPEISHTEDTEIYLYYDEDHNTNTTGYPFNWWASLSPENASDSFPVNGTPNEALWYSDYPGAYVQNGKLVMDLSSGNTFDRLDSTYTVYGDFDIQVDWDLSSAVTTDGWYIGLHAETANPDLTFKGLFARRRYDISNGHNYNSGYSDGGGWTSVYTPTTSGSGKLRITREDHVVKSYYYEDGSWQLNQTGTLTNLDNVPMSIILYGSSNVGEPTLSAYFDNFTVNKAFIITDNYLASDTFIGPDYSEPNREKWRSYPDRDKFVLKDNSLYGEVEGTNATLYNTHWVDGDFDVQVDFNIVNGPATNDWYTWMRFWGRDSNDLFITGYAGMRYRSSAKSYFASFYNSGWTGETNTGTADTSGKFRFYRNGNIIYSQYWNGASWTTMDSEDYGAAPEVVMLFEVGSSNGNPNVQVKYDNFKVNSARRVRGYSGTSSGPASVQVWDPRYQFVCHFGQYDYPLGGYTKRVYGGAIRQYRGTAQSNMTYSDIVAGQVGKAFDFDGTDDYVDFGTFNPSSGDLTIEFLWNIDQLASDLGHSHHPIAKRDTWAAAGMMWQMHINTANDKLAFTTYTDWTGSQVGEFDTLIQRIGEWQNLAIVHDSGATDYMYVDGEFVESHSAITLDSKTDAALTVAAYATGSSPFDGKISEVRISNMARTPTWLESTYYSLFDDLLYIDWLPGPQGFDSTKYIQFFVDHSNIDNTLSNFPIRFRISKQSGIDNIDITRVFNELSYAARKKIAVTTADQTTQCYVEIENWDDSRQEANLWIKALSLSPQQQTEFYLYYDSTASDNTDWVGDTGDVAAQNVWDSNFQIVSHQEQDPTEGAGAILDSTNNSNNGTAYNMESGDLIDGRPGKALDYDGSAEYCDFGDAFYSDRFTVEVYVNPDVVGDTDVLALKRNNVGTVTKQDPPEWQLNMNSTGTAQFTGWKAGAVYDVLTDTGLLSAGSYYYVAGASAGNGSQVRVTVNDIEYGSSNATDTLNNQTSAIQIAARSNDTDTRWGDIKVSEFRVSNVYRSAEWRKATYHTLNDDMIYFRMPWDDTHSEILLTVSGTLIDEDLTNFPLTLTLASGVGTNTEDVTKIFDGLTLSGTLGYFDDFTGWDGDEPNTTLWYKDDSAPNSYMEIEGNRLKQVHDINDTVDQLYYSYFTISGDFDIQMDYELVADLTTNSWWGGGIRVYPQDSSGYWAFMQRGYSTTKHHRFRYNGDGGNSFTDSVTTLTSGTCRLTRSGSYLSGYYRAIGDTSWTQVGVATDWSAIDIKVALNSVKNFSSTVMTIYADNFTVNSGIVHADQTRKRIAIFSGGGQHTGDKCFTEIEHWDAVNETATLHVQIPTLISGTDTDLYLYEDINQPDQDYRLISEANDTFTAASGTAPDHTRWKTVLLQANSVVEIQSNKLRMTNATADSGSMKLETRYVVSGDLDVHIDFDRIDSLGVSSDIGLRAISVDNTSYNFRIAQVHDGNYYFAWADSGGSGSTTEAITETSGKLRLTRVGTTTRAYRWVGAAWDEVGSGHTWETDDVVIQLVVYKTYTSGPLRCDWDNFTVTSGTVTGFVDDIGGRPAQEVWDSNFKGVWHMATLSSGVADSVLDSTSNVIDMTSNNMEAADLVIGRVGKALSFGGTDEYLTEPDNDALDISGGFTAEVLFNLNSTFDYLEANDHGLLSRYHGTYAYGDWLIRLESDTGKLKTGWVNAGVAWQDLDSVKDSWDADTWYYIANTTDSAGTEITIQKSLDNSDGLDRSARDSDDEFIIGAKAGYSTPFEGKIDEVRISSTARSTAWRGTTHDSLFDDLVFYDLLEPTPTPPTPPTPSGLADAMGWTKINDVLTSGIVVRLYRRSDGSLVGEDISATLSGIWNIPTTYDEYHYAIGLYPTSGTNSLIYDWLHPTLNP